MSKLINDELWTPKQISNDIFQLVGELNTLLGGNYFIATLFPTTKGNYKYQLDYTTWAWKHDKKYKELCIEEAMNFKHKEMKAYLLGLTSGLRISIK
nr:MAG TPA: hypothetical protein [Bacteriophage sp.]